VETIPNDIIAEAVEHTLGELERAAPWLARQIAPWTQRLAGSDRPADYFTRDIAFPMLLLPWWLEQTLHSPPDRDFQRDLIRSTISGYYYIRLIDNVMDEGAEIERKLLPAVGFFHTQFQTPYQRHFPDTHPFWELFKRVWFHTADATAHDAALLKIDRAAFITVAAQKVSAAQIPLAAVCYRYERTDLIADWARLIDLLGAWSQMLNDLTSWHRDLTHGTPTYLLSEAERRRRADETTAAWVLREGFAWAITTLEGWMAEIDSLAERLGSPELQRYLAQRSAQIRTKYEQSQAGLRSAAHLLELAGQARQPKEQQ
jgi:hypothetical protein